MSNTWGALSWGAGSWAAQGDVGLAVSGISASFSIGVAVADAEVQVGWGGDTWGENEWGDLSGSQPIAVGSQLTSSIGSLSTTADANVSVTGIALASSLGGETAGVSFTFSATGLQLTSSVGANVIEIGVPVTGISATSSAGATTVDESQLTGIGWGRKTWGNLAWGGAYSAIATGQQLTSAINFPAANAFTDVTVAVSSPALTMTFSDPSFSIQIDQNITILATEHGLDTSTNTPSVTGLANVSATGNSASITAGSVIAGLKTPVDVSGIQSTMSLGSITLIQTTNEQPSGIQATMSLGQHAEIPGQIIGVSGQQISSSVGSVTATGEAAVDVTGIQMTISVGSPNITAWAEIDPGVNNVWTEVDLAA